MKLSRWMLKEKRGYVIEKIKAPLLMAIVKYCKRYPEPTRENTTRHNTHILLNIRDKFFSYETNRGRRELFEAAWRMLIAEYEHDRYYGDLFDWLIEEISKSDWKPRAIGHPVYCWEEPYEGDCKVKEIECPEGGTWLGNLLLRP
jgi:hypothetical protein